MIIKKFQGKTEKDAVNAAKAELGENVVIMHVRQTKPKGLFSFFRRKVYEVSAAKEEESDTSMGRIADAVNAIKAVVPTDDDKLYTSNKDTAKKIETVKPQEKSSSDIIEAATDAFISEKTNSYSVKSGNIEEKLESLHNLLEKQLVKNDADTKEAKQEDDKNTDFFKLIYNTLIDNEVNEKYVNDIIDDAAALNRPNASIDYILANIYQKMILKFGKTETINEAKDGPKVIFFVGTTGVGKTTTIAKIASKLSVNDKKKVTLLTTDTYRIAAAEQLRTYANILEAPFRVIYSTDELTKALKDYESSDYILIDTAGHSQNNEDQKNGMKQFLDCVDAKYDKDVYLVLSATTKYRDLISVCDTYSEFTGFKLIFTKLDETSTLGNLYNIKLHTGAMVSYVTCGQNVPDDIEEFNPQRTVKMLLGGK